MRLCWPPKMMVRFSPNQALFLSSVRSWNQWLRYIRLGIKPPETQPSPPLLQTPAPPPAHPRIERSSGLLGLPNPSLKVQIEPRERGPVLGAPMAAVHGPPAPNATAATRWRWVSPCPRARAREAASGVAQRRHGAGSPPPSTALRPPLPVAPPGAAYSSLCLISRSCFSDSLVDIYRSLCTDSACSCDNIYDPLSS